MKAGDKINQLLQKKSKNVDDPSIVDEQVNTFDRNLALERLLAASGIRKG